MPFQLLHNFLDSFVIRVNNNIRQDMRYYRIAQTDTDLLWFCQRREDRLAEFVFSYDSSRKFKFVWLLNKLEFVKAFLSENTYSFFHSMGK